MMDDEFIDGVLTLDSQGGNATMNRKFIGMEAVQADNHDYDENEGGDNE